MFFYSCIAKDSAAEFLVESNLTCVKPAITTTKLVPNATCERSFLQTLRNTTTFFLIGNSQNLRVFFFRWRQKLTLSSWQTKTKKNALLYTRSICVSSSMMWYGDVAGFLRIVRK
jgi:hypothetical protein